MKQFLRSKLTLTLIAFVIIAAVVIPLSRNNSVFAAATSPHNSSRGPRFMPLSSYSGPKCPPSPAYCDLILNGGQVSGSLVQKQPVVYTIFWGKSWSTSKGLNADGTTVQSYLQNVGSSNYANILSQYYDANGHISKNISFGGMWIDPSDPPTDTSCTNKTVQDAKIHDEVSTAISTNHWPQDNVNATFFVYTPNGYAINAGNTCSNKAFCGYHSIFGNNTVYAEIVFPTGACSVKKTGGSVPKGDSDTGETLATITAHEQFEAATDPDTVHGWQDVNGGTGEIGDKCNFNFSNGLTKLNGTQFEVQTEYSNVVHDCVNSYTPGNIWLTGHDPDFHCTFQSYQCNYLKVATTFARGSSTLPLLVLDHGTEVQTALGNAFLASLNMQVVDPRSGFASVALVDATGKTLYSVIIVASDITCGGCDNNDFGITPDSNALNARAEDIARFFSAGGSILALAGADNSASYYQFLPTPFTVTGISVTSPFQFTALGLSLGLIEGSGSSSDDNCCATHNSFSIGFLVPANDPYQVAELDGSAFAETLIFQGH